jgi:hypothetical protein
MPRVQPSRTQRKKAEPATTLAADIRSGRDPAAPLQIGVGVHAGAKWWRKVLENAGL